ncbi:hypothetical protein BT96DRAFT_856508 [Gymnopus androsaceus JB14]|uniref:DUF6593 domain-containing protein n=1 Tax=Gymnopus androsaceus JB14 TaxID=1447944 RepID=A0A6A4HR16_9AGAR|nr:hypothetical protein BT96DRAFT_856508 [Gymnopus androsaceus JB14]
MSSTVPRLVLILEPDNPCNTNMYDEQDGRILYQVMTEYNQEIITKVRNMNGDTIASWQWRESRSDIITLGSAHPMSLNTWLKKSIIPFNKDTVTFQDQIGRHFKWKGCGTRLPLELYSEHDKTNPIAYFEKSSQRRPSHIDDWDAPSGSQRLQSKLVVDQRGEEILDLVVISFVVLEKNRRAAENPAWNGIETLPTPPMGRGLDYRPRNGQV